MVGVTDAGAVLVPPPVPALYHHPRTIGDVIDHTAGKVLDHLFRRSGGV